MTLSRRDEFAKAALAGLVTRADNTNSFKEDAGFCVKSANALIAALGEEQESLEEIMKRRLLLLEDALAATHKRLAIRERQLELALKELAAHAEKVYSGRTNVALKEIQAMEKGLADGR